jgi:transcriptional regulator with XRE-family HTH domain
MANAAGRSVPAPEAVVKSTVPRYHVDMTTTPSDLVAGRIQANRQARGWSAKELAARCASFGASDLTAAVIANIETGRRNSAGRRRRDVTVDELFALSLALEVTPVDLLQIAGQGTIVQITPDVGASSEELLPWLKGERNSVIPGLLRALASCAACQTLVLTRRATRGPVYFCPNESCPAPVTDSLIEYVDLFISELIVGRLQREDIIHMLFPDSADETTQPPTDSVIEDIDEQIKQLSERKSQAYREFERLVDYPDLSPEIIARSISSFDGKIRELQKRRADISKRLLLERNQGIIRETWEGKLSLADRRLLVSTLMNVSLNRVTRHISEETEPGFSPDEVTIKWITSSEGASS